MWLDIVNTLLEAAVLIVIILDIRLYYNREKKQEVRDKAADERDIKYLALQEKVIELLGDSQEVLVDSAAELADMRDAIVEGQDDEPNTNREELDREAGEVGPISSSPNTFTDPRS